MLQKKKNCNAETNKKKRQPPQLWDTKILPWLTRRKFRQAGRIRTCGLPIFNQDYAINKAILKSG
jgi:hypothetical protein